MNDIKVSIAQLTPKLEDKQFNLQLTLNAIKQAGAEESDLIVFPELFWLVIQ